MESIRTLIQRPSTLPAAYAPVPAVVLACAPSAVVVRKAIATAPAVWAPVGSPRLPRAHQAEVTLAERVDGSNGISGFSGDQGIPTARKRLMGAVRGVPPRGRPV